MLIFTGQKIVGAKIYDFSMSAFRLEPQPVGTTNHFKNCPNAICGLGCFFKNSTASPRIWHLYWELNCVFTSPQGFSMNHSSFLQGPSSHETCLASPRQMVIWAPGKCQRRLIIKMSARLDSQVWLKYCAGVGAGSWWKFVWCTLWSVLFSFQMILKIEHQYESYY